METNFIKHFSFNFKEIIIDEIALNGLEGIGFDLLWKHIQKRISVEVTTKMKIRLWNFIVKCDQITLYKIPESLPHFEIVDRMKIVAPNGWILDPVDYPDGPYNYCPVDNEHGSCEYYAKRRLLSKVDLKTKTYDEVATEFGDRLVMVASLEDRWQALAPHVPITVLSQFTQIHYCLLELIGRGRENGQMSFGKSNILKIVKDPKLLFYNRKVLQDLDLIKLQNVTQIVDGKGTKCLFMRLKRFHKPAILTMPTAGTLHNVIEHLKEQPDYAQRSDLIIKLGFMDYRLLKKLQKNTNIFQFDERSLPDTKNKNKAGARTAKFMSLTSPSDEEPTDSDDETKEEPMKCEYNVKINLKRQAYERFLEAGLKGLTQIELAKLLGVEFYTARTLCKSFKTRNIVREFMVDKGRQRVSRYIAVSAASTLVQEYEEEKKKFLQFMTDKPKNQSKPQDEPKLEDPELQERPRKRVKLEVEDKNSNNEFSIDCKNIDKQVTEVQVLDGLENVNTKFSFSEIKLPSMRQLKYINAVLKVLQEKQVVQGYHTLSSLAAKEIGESPMDSKAIKLLLQKLLSQKKLKILKMKKPGFENRWLELICASNVNATDKLIKTKYKELRTRALNNRKIVMKKAQASSMTKDLSIYSYPRYMKIQKLHELIFKVVYVDNNTVDTDLPKGFSSLVHIIPEFTVEFAMGNISHLAISEIPAAKLKDHMLPSKLRDIPSDVFKLFVLSASLQSSIRMNLKVLAMLGLIQLIKESMSNYDVESTILTYVFYVNRNAKIIDTTGVWPRNDVDVAALEKVYYFETFKDVEKYWSDVYNVSVKTSIDLESRPRKTLAPPLRAQGEALEHDKALIFGDGLGPCGFDSVFYMELPRFWSTYYMKEKKRQETVPLGKKIAFKIPKIRKSRKKATPNPQVVAAKPKTPRLRAPEVRKMKESWLQWSQRDDDIITYCKAAIAILSPGLQPDTLRLRNYSAKDILCLTDPNKSAGSCHKRAMVLQSNLSLEHEKECIVNELRYRSHLISKYEGNALKKLRTQYYNLGKFLAEGRKYMFELVWIIWQLVHSKNYKKRNPCVAKDLQDFYQKYTITLSSANNPVNLYKFPDDCDDSITVIKEAIICLLMSSYKRTVTAEESTTIYAILNKYPESDLRKAVEQLRKCSALSSKDKMFHTHISKFNLQDVVRMTYKISVSYERKWINRLNAELVMQVAAYLDSELSATNLKGDPGLNCVSCELQACNQLEMSFVAAPTLTLPAGLNEDQISTTELENKLVMKSGSCMWRNKSNVRKLSDLYKDIELDYKLSTINEIPAASKKPPQKNPIISYLSKKCEKGATYRELQDFTGYDDKTLKNNLSTLESENMIKRVGFYENLVILSEFLEAWTIQLENAQVTPLPWLTLGKNIRFDIFFKWASVVTNKLFDCPGSSMSYLADSCEFLTARSALELCTFLDKCGCVTLQVVRSSEPDLFSDEEVAPEIFEYNEYEAMENIVAFPVKDMLTRFAYVKKSFLDKHCNEEQTLSSV